MEDTQNYSPTVMFRKFALKSALSLSEHKSSFIGLKFYFALNLTQQEY